MLRKKTRNRRFDRAHVLDVKLRSRHIRAVRARVAATVFSVITGTVLAFFLLWRAGEWALDEFVFKNTVFSVREIDVQTDGSIPLAQLRAWAGVNEGDNLLAVDLPRIRRDLELSPMIKSASIVKVLPHQLRIRVSERKPIAQVSVVQVSPSSGNLASAVFFLDDAGYVLAPLDPRRRPVEAMPAFGPLPAVTGLDARELRPGRPLESLPAHAALRWIGAFRRSPMVGMVDVKEIDVAEPGVLLVRTAQGAEVTFPLDPPSVPLRRWRQVHDFAASSGRAVATLDLSVTNNVPARWIEPADAPVPSHLLKAPLPRRRNV